MQLGRGLPQLESPPKHSNTLTCSSSFDRRLSAVLFSSPFSSRVVMRPRILIRAHLRESRLAVGRSLPPWVRGNTPRQGSEMPSRYRMFPRWISFLSKITSTDDTSHGFFPSLALPRTCQVSDPMETGVRTIDDSLASTLKTVSYTPTDRPGPDLCRQIMDITNGHI